MDEIISKIKNDTELLFQINVKDKILLLIYDKTRNGLYNMFHYDKDMANFINEHIDECFIECIECIDNSNIYLLNIASTEDFGYFDWNKEEKRFLQSMLQIFSPIVNRFVANAVCGVNE